nr:LysM peptidoglycan-binding domain-containing protein [Propionibacterium sp.]
MIRQRLGGLAAVLGIAALLVGLPAALLQVRFGVLPTITGWDDLVALLLRRDDGSLALAVIKTLGWFTWALLAGLILLEVVALLRGVRAPTLPGLRLPQTAARTLVSAATALFVALPQPINLAQATPAHAAPVTAPAAVATPTSAPTRPAASTQNAGADAQTRPYQVKRGESLWSIAEKQLGNGRRYTEIAALNQHLLGGQGDTFLKPGWVLALPIDHPNEPVAEHTVRPGDTLSQIARDHYGDADQYPRIFAASTGLPQPDGQQLTDPDLILPGWTLRLPGSQHATPSSTQPTSEERLAPPSAPAATGSTPAVVPTTAPALPSASAPEPAAAQQPAAAEPGPDVTETEAAPAPAWLLGSLIGAGTVLGGGLWVALLRRRRALFRNRRPGRMIAAPATALVPVEKTLTVAGPPAADLALSVDRALHRLAGRRGAEGQPMPALTAVELDDTHLRLHLAGPADLPGPWQQGADHTHWDLALDTDLDQIGPDNKHLPAPYPQLVTVGSADDGRLWLLNLEACPVVRLTGDADYVHEFTRYLAAELAVNPWSLYVTVECVGVAAEVVELNSWRLRYHDTDAIAADFTADIVQQIDRCTTTGLDVVTGRATIEEDDLWEGRLLLLDSYAPGSAIDEVIHLLHAHPGATGSSLVVVHGQDPALDGVEIHLTNDGRLQVPSLGLDLVAVGLTADEATGCALLCGQNDEVPDDEPIPPHPEPAEGWQTHADQAGHLLAEHTLPRDPPPVGEEETTSLLPQADDAYLDVAATTADDLARLAPQVTTATRTQIEQADPTLDDDLRSWNDPRCDLPRLRLLGPVTVRVAPTGQPTAAAGRKPFLTELVAYLATRPNGATTQDVADAMNITPSRVRKDLLVARAWLGQNPRTGRAHVPDSRQTAAAKNRGRAAYQIEGLLVDADLFRRLRVRGVARGGAEGLADLQQALTLVNGTPFDQLRATGGAWLAEGDRLDQILLCAVLDVAHLVSVAALEQGDLDQARAAAELALKVAPHEEPAHLDLAAVLHAQGHHHAAEKHLHHHVYYRRDDDGAPNGVPPRTERILNQRDRRTDPRAKATA